MATTAQAAIATFAAAHGWTPSPYCSPEHPRLTRGEVEIILDFNRTGAIHEATIIETGAETVYLYRRTPGKLARVLTELFRQTDAVELDAVAAAPEIAEEAPAPVAAAEAAPVAVPRMVRIEAGHYQSADDGRIVVRRADSAEGELKGVGWHLFVGGEWCETFETKGEALDAYVTDLAAAPEIAEEAPAPLTAAEAAAPVIEAQAAVTATQARRELDRVHEAAARLERTVEAGTYAGTPELYRATRDELWARRDELQRVYRDARARGRAASSQARGGAASAEIAPVGDVVLFHVEPTLFA